MSQFLRSCIPGLAIALTTLGMVSLVAAQTPPKVDIRGLLKQKIDIDFKRTSLDNVLKHIVEVHGLNIVIAPDVAAAGIDLSRRVIDLKVKQVSVERILALILGADLGYKIEPGVIVIKPRSKIVAEVVTRTYPDPFASVAPLRGGEFFDEFIDVIQRNVNNMGDPLVAPWKDEGGAATITRGRGQQLTIAQTDRGHERIANLLKSLASVVRGRRPPTAPESKEVRLTRTRLQKKVDVNFQNLSLHQALQQLSGMQPELNIVIDPNVAASGIYLAARVVDLNVRQAPIETVLKSILGKDLGFKAEEGFILITTCEGLMRNLPCVVHLVRPGRKMFEWYQEIKKLVNQASDPEIAAWRDDGGPASLDFLPGRQPPDYALIVTQTPAGQRRVAELLQKWRP